MIRNQSYRQRRDGVILVVVVSMLALFAVIGLGYVIYAESAATSSRISRDAQVVVSDRAEVEPEVLLNQILGALIYDKPDDVTGVYSALRGHSLARSMYGWNPPVTVLDPLTNQQVVVNFNTVPFNGTGTLRVGDINGVVPRHEIINFVPRFSANALDRIVRNPEVYQLNPAAANQYRTLTSPTTIQEPSVAANLQPRYFGGANAPYTYPDLNNVFLGAIRASDGMVLVPSYHRPWLFKGPNNVTPDLTFLFNANHPDWYRPSGRLKLLRPRPVDQLTQAQVQAAIGSPTVPENISAGQITQLRNYIANLQVQGKMLPYPSDAGGDVKNLLGAPGGNDSVWLDLGFPVRQTKSGKKYKPLVAMLITDLDGRVNLNAHGNLRGTAVISGSPYPAPNNPLRTHISDQGIGRHEVNPLRVFTQPSIAQQFGTPAQPNTQMWQINTNLTEYANLFRGANTVPGRYDTQLAPNYQTMANRLSSFMNPARQPHVYTNADPIYNDPPYYRVDVDAARREQIAGNPYEFRALPNRGWAYETPTATSRGYPLMLSGFSDYHTAPGSLPIQLFDTSVGAPNPATYTNAISAVATNIGHDNDNEILERFNHPLLYNPLRKILGDNSRLLNAKETSLLIARYNSPLDYGESLLSKLMPVNLSDPRVRHMITLLSADVGRPGLAPMSNGTTNYTFQTQQQIPWSPQGATFPAVSDPPPPNHPYDYSNQPVYTFNSLPVVPTTPAGGIRPITDAGGKPVYPFDGRSSVPALLSRLDLNRPLIPFPQLQFAANGVSYPPGTEAQVRAANADRQLFAEDIFERLRAAVGTADISQITAPNAEPYPTLRYLAQLAVNIVDYIDGDEVMTRFVFKPQNAGAPDGLTDKDREVWGVEMPRVALNEVYVEQTNGTGNTPYVRTIPTPPPTRRQADQYRMNVFVELHHTMVPPQNRDNDPVNFSNFEMRHKVWLRNTINGQPQSTYLVHLIRGDTQAANLPTVGEPPANLSPEEITPAPKRVDFAMEDPMAPPDLKPVDTALSNGAMAYRNPTGSKNSGFYWIGATTDDLSPPGTKFDMNPTPALRSANMRYDVKSNVTPRPPNVILQRLANPYAVKEPNPASPNYNPYITVDMFNLADPSLTIPNLISKAIQWDDQPRVNPLPDSTNKTSICRQQPLTASSLQITTSGTGATSPPDNSFERHNSRNQTPPNQLPETGKGMNRFDWLVHLDRKLVSPVELLHVAAVSPWDLTQRFVFKDAGGKANRLGHTAAWLDETEKFDQMDPNNRNYKGEKNLFNADPVNPPQISTRLYRALEFFRVGDRTVEMAFGGRDLGKININTIWDKQVFDALCDAIVKANAGNQLLDSSLGFTQADVDSAWSAMTNQDYGRTASRTPFLYTWIRANNSFFPTNVAPTQPYALITGNDRPFWGMGAPHEAINSPQYPVVPTGIAARPVFQNAGIEATLFRSMTPFNPSFDPPTDQVLLPRRGRLFDAESQFDTSAGNPPNPTNPDPPLHHPLLEKSLLSKIFEHLTTRSNVFAVYITVGYFEVLDDTQKPELLGDEIGMLRDTTGVVVENKTIRHRMFSIVDRTNLTLDPGTPAKEGNPLRQGPPPFYYSTTPVMHPYGGIPSVRQSGLWIITLPASNFDTGAPNPRWCEVSYNGITMHINGTTATQRPSTVLYIGSGSDMRRVAVRNIRSIMNGTFAELEVGVPPPNGAYTGWTPLSDNPVAPAHNPPWPLPPNHPMTVTNAIAGNPVPQPDFDFRQPNYRGVVLYSVIMD